MGQIEYPKREAYFAHRYCRLLTKTCAAQDIGPDGCWLLCVIAMLEDSKRYTDAVTFYNGQLMAVAGFTREHTLITVRNRTIKAGWLHYDAGTRRRAARYWVMIPDRFADIPDGPCDEAAAGSPDENVSDQDSMTDEFVSRRVGKASVVEQSSRQSFLPTPIPKESPSSSRTRHTYDPAFETWYARYPLKAGKLDAARAYAKAAKRVGHQKLLDAVERFRQSDQARGDYCWHPATFLNGGHYEDPPITWQSRNGQPRPKDDPLQELEPA